MKRDDNADDNDGVLIGSKNRKDDFDEVTAGLPDKPSGSNLDTLKPVNPKIPGSE
jgi:hypothetical protein